MVHPFSEIPLSLNLAPSPIYYNLKKKMRQKIYWPKVKIDLSGQIWYYIEIKA